LSNEFIGEGTPLGDVPDNIPSPSDHPNGQNPFPEDFGVMKTYKKGDIIAGKIVEIQNDAVLIDIQTKTEGVLQKEEISFAPNPTTENLAVGQEIEVMVIKEGEDVYMLSKRRVDEKKIWERVELAQKENKRVQGKIIASVNGGLIVDIGGRAFLPQSQIDIKKIDDMETMIGQEIEVKVLEHDREKNRLVVSRRLCIEEDLDKEKLQAFDNFKKGQTLEGKVEKIVDYGVFVNLGNGMTGLLHVSELSWERVDNPRSILKVGDPIQVKVLKVDKEKQKISLSRKATLAEPWDLVMEKYRPGTITEGTVTRVTTFGCFIKLDDFFEGLAHISELVDQRISHAKEVFTPGDKVTVLVLDVDKKRKRIRLSVKKALEKQTEREVNAFLKQQGELDNTLGSRFGGALSSLDLSTEESEPSEPVVKVEPAVDLEPIPPEIA
jgi:small subunit ribosomal protein S1